jgi:DNA primase
VTFVEEFLVGQPGRIRQIFELGGVVFSGARNGSEHHARCAFHDDPFPSMDVNLDKGLFICRACGERGNAVQFHARRNGLTKEAAIADLRGVLGLAQERRP